MLTDYYDVLYDYLITGKWVYDDVARVAMGDWMRANCYLVQSVTGYYYCLAPVPKELKHITAKQWYDADRFFTKTKAGD